MNASSLNTQIPLPKHKTKYMSSTIASSILKNLLNVHSCQMQLKHAIDIEYKICIKKQTIVKFEKFNFIYKNL